ncbi:MAG: ATP-binding protein [Verrucomicrobiota bacterium]
MNSNRWQKFKRLSALLPTPATDTAYQASRLRFMERDIGLPVKLVVWLLLYYYLFLSTWFEGLSEVGDLTLKTVHQFFLGYLVINIGVAFVLFFMHRLPLSLVQWVVFTTNLIDGLFLGAVTLVTGGLESIAYWVFLALIIRNAFSFPVASFQLTLNLLIICCYLSATVMSRAITELELTTLAVDQAAGSTNLVKHVRALLKVHPRPLAESGLTRTNLDASAPTAQTKPKTRPGSSIDRLRRVPAGEPENEPDTQYLLMRIVLLLLMTACGYGVQVLFDKQRRAEEEAGEFALRQEQLRSAGRLAAEIAHQIKNPLGIINNAAFTLQRTVKEGKGTITQQIQIIREEVARSDRIITELIGYAQLAEGRVEKLDVIEELESAITRVLPAAAKYQIEVRRDYGTALPPLLIQRNHLAEIFGNLLQNAREVLNGHGIIEVSAHYVKDYSVMIAIADNGPGISPELCEKIFEAYFTTRERGTGLGLAIVKHNVETYGGTVRVESELGKGTRFVLVFPGRTLMKLRK